MRSRVSYALVLASFALLIVGCSNTVEQRTPEVSTQENVDDLAKYISLDGAWGLEGVGIGSNSVVEISKPDTAGGVGFYAALRSEGREIKYLTMHVTPYNKVGDAVFDEISNESTRSVKVTGPIGSSDFVRVGKDNLWYNPTIEYALVEKVEIEYMSGDLTEFQLQPALRAERRCLFPSGGASNGVSCRPF